MHKRPILGIAQNNDYPASQTSFIETFYEMFNEI